MILATDLDGTLAHGSREDILKIYSLIEQHNLKLIYVTGRDIKNFRKLTKNFIKEKGVKLLLPDYLVTLNGSKIYKKRNTILLPIMKFQLDRKWFNLIKHGWNKKRCLEALRITADKIRMPSGKSSIAEVKYKPSPLFLETVVYYKDLSLIKATLEDECSKRGTKVNIIFDYLEKHYVDMGLKVLDKIDRRKAVAIREMRNDELGVCVMMVSATNKGESVDYIRKSLSLTKEQTIVAGDGGNDFHLLSTGFESIVVANANQLLLKQPLEEISNVNKQKLIYTKSEGAKGLFEGLNIVLDKTFSHCSDSSLRSVINT